MEKNPKNPKIYDCEICSFTTRNKKDHDKHLLTAKHLKQVERYQKISKKPQKPQTEPYYCECGNAYKHTSGLWRHKKKCITTEAKVVSSAVVVHAADVVPPAADVIPADVIPADVQTLTTMVMELMKSNGELQKQMVEMCKNSNMTINNLTHNNHSNNKTFNLMFFLNEQCKDAMNLSDFMNSFELGLEDLESIGELGYVEGITKIMVDRLNAMDIYKRPVHCSDAKRETLYVKNDDKWEKEARHNPKLRYAIKTASFQSMKLTVLWSDTYPESKSSESRLNDKYMKLVFNSTGGTGEIADSEDKIIRRILKEIVIDKS
jgi:hypothetical protein